MNINFIYALFYLCSYTNNQLFNVPIGGKIPDLDHMLPVEEEVQWSEELAISTLHYTSECVTAYTLTLCTLHTRIMLCWIARLMVEWHFIQNNDANNGEIRAYANVFTQENAAVRRKDWGVCLISVRPNMIMVRNRGNKQLIKTSIHCDLCLKITSQSLLTVLSVWPMTVIKAIVLSAHDKGSHAEVQVKVRKVFQSGQVALYLGTSRIYPLSWTSRGCTCPILNPGKICSKHGKGNKSLMWYMKHCIIDQ